MKPTRGSLLRTGQLWAVAVLAMAAMKVAVVVTASETPREVQVTTMALTVTEAQTSMELQPRLAAAVLAAALAAARAAKATRPAATAPHQLVAMPPASPALPAYGRATTLCGTRRS